APFVDVTTGATRGVHRFELPGFASFARLPSRLTPYGARAGVRGRRMTHPLGPGGVRHLVASRWPRDDAPPVERGGRSSPGHRRPWFAARAVPGVSIRLVYEHMFVTSDGNPYSRFRRALETGNEALVTAAALELPRI